jgi:hypothetical protein
MPDPATDTAILNAASRAIGARKARQRWIAGAAALAASVAVLIIGFGIRTPQPKVVQETASYGRFEGNTRPFLLRGSDVVGIGPGSTSFIQIDEPSEDGGK